MKLWIVYVMVVLALAFYFGFWVGEQHARDKAADWFPSACATAGGTYNKQVDSCQFPKPLTTQ